MEQQQATSAAILARKIGTRQQVIIDKTDATGGIGRTRADAPEIDGTVRVASRRPLRMGDIITVKIDRAGPYDLTGTAV
jgi:ribosomal protein S12 methylthiotransferase